MAGRAQGRRGRGLPGLGGVGTHGTRYSPQLLSVCFRPMMMAICTNRSIMQPLAWHCGARPGRGSGRGPGGRAGEQWPEAWGRLTSSSFHKPARRVDFPGWPLILGGKGRSGALQACLGQGGCSRTEAERKEQAGQALR